MNLSKESPANREKLVHSCFRNNLLQEKDPPVVTETISDIHPDIVIERDPLTPGVLSDDSSGSVSVLGLQNFQQAPAGRQ